MIVAITKGRLGSSTEGREIPETNINRECAQYFLMTGLARRPDQGGWSHYTATTGQPLQRRERLIRWIQQGGQFTAEFAESTEIRDKNLAPRTRRSLPEGHSRQDTGTVRDGVR
jgi:hypothetical protein